MRGSILTCLGTGKMLSVQIFCIGMMTGVIMTSLVANYTSLTNKLVYRSVVQPSRDQELIALVKEFNKTLVLHAHNEHEQVSQDKDPIYFKDEHLHKDDMTVAKKLYKDVRVYCWVLTTEKFHQSKDVHVKATWGRRCNKRVFISDAADASLPAIKINTELGRGHLTAKTMQAFDLAHKDVDNFDWFMKADDDTYVILENLRYFLSSQNPESPVYFGHHFKLLIRQGYFSGGGGYVISREALRRYGKRNPDLCAKDSGAEDVEFGRCMEKLGVKTGDSRDKMGRSRFHGLSTHLLISGNFPDWYHQFDKYGGKKGMGNISDYAISFHYMEPKDMYNMELFIYHIRPYGITSGNQDLNAAAQVVNGASQNTSNRTRQ